MLEKENTPIKFKGIINESLFFGSLQNKKFFTFINKIHQNKCFSLIIMKREKF